MGNWRMVIVCVQLMWTYVLLRSGEKRIDFLKETTVRATGFYFTLQRRFLILEKGILIKNVNIFKCDKGGKYHRNSAEFKSILTVCGELV